MQKCFSALLTAALPVGLYLPAHADAPWEKYHVSRSSISGSVLKNAIGVLTISNGHQRNAKQLKIYKQKSGDFHFDRIISPLETNPVSNFSYHPPIRETDVGNFRFPILKRDREFLKIAIDSQKPVAVWVKETDLKIEFYLESVFFDKMVGMQGFVDPFFGNREKPLQIYEGPSLKSKSKSFSGDEWAFYQVIAQDGEFIQIGIPAFPDEANGTKPKPVGWVRIKDRRGLLEIWIGNMDMC